MVVMLLVDGDDDIDDVGEDDNQEASLGAFDDQQMTLAALL